MKNLLSAYPTIASEWHPVKNDFITPDEVVAGSGKKYWWQCPNGPDHEWQASVYKRTKDGRGCPFCKGLKVSVTKSLATLFPKLAKEWHSNKNGDITPNKVTSKSNKVVWWQCAQNHEWQTSISNRAAGTGCPFCCGKKVSPTNSLAAMFPKIAREWHPTKNVDTTPETIVAGSNKKVWWKCSVADDHEWMVSVSNRTYTKRGCPFCVGRNVAKSNSLASLRPNLVSEWHPIKNDDLIPSKVTTGSRIKIWWKCSSNPEHEWQAVINKRARRGDKCPFCVNKQVSSTNSLAVLFPKIATEWHPTKNGKLKPEQIVAGSGKQYWWKCLSGPDHEWKTTLVSRTREGTGCPFCAGIKVSVTNSLKSLFPNVASEWHLIKNKNLTTDKVVAGSNSLVWWKCSKGDDHEWKGSVNSRTYGNYGCPFCRGFRVSIINSLESLFPKIAAEWHPTKNGDLTPDKVVAGSNKKLWWLCSKNIEHEWQTTLSNRTGKGKTGCPYCGGDRASSSYSLNALFPEVSKEWHPQKNADLTPDQIVPGSTKIIWWQCLIDQSHEWVARVKKRTRKNRPTGCPFCKLVPRSKPEIMLAFELLQFFNFDINSYKLSIGKKIIDVDILIPNLKLIIEYDGSYWHRNKEHKDQAKNKTLVNAGWKVIRVREEPLEPVGIYDFQLPRFTNENLAIKECANIVLVKIEEICNIKISDLSNYLKIKNLVNSKAATEYINQFLDSKNQN